MTQSGQNTYAGNGTRPLRVSASHTACSKGLLLF